MAPRKRRASKGGTLGNVKEAAAKQKGKAEWLKLDDGDEVVMRVLDTGKDFKDCYVHRVPMESDDGKSTYYADVPCLDQDETGIACPGCKDDLNRRYKFWTNVIVRGDEDSKDKDEQKDRLMIYSGGITVAKKLDKMDARHGLDNRDIILEREGKKMQDTKYEVEWADEEDVPLTSEDKALAEKKHDLSRYTKIPDYDDFYKRPSERGGGEDVGEESVKRGSAFKRRQKEDEGERKTASRRRSSSKSSKPAGLAGFGKQSGDSSAKKTVRRRRSR